MLENIRRRPGGTGRTGLAPAVEEQPRGALQERPRHVAIIMDGNGRWATDRGLPRVAGHRAGVEALKRVVRACPDLGIAVLTVYAFSTENWKRPKDEVDALMRLILEYCRREVEELGANGVQVRALGRVQDLPSLQRAELQRAIERTRHNSRMVLNLALNYGSHTELVDAFQRIMARVQAGELRAEDVTEDVINAHLYTAGLPEPDLIIRTGGEFRLSNFLLWQAAYAELWVTPVYWPEFGAEHLAAAVADFGQRERRFGAVGPVRDR